MVDAEQQKLDGCKKFMPYIMAGVLILIAIVIGYKKCGDNLFKKKRRSRKSRKDDDGDDNDTSFSMKEEFQKLQALQQSMMAAPATA